MVRHASAAQLEPILETSFRLAYPVAMIAWSVNPNLPASNARQDSKRIRLGNAKKFVEMESGFRLNAMMETPLMAMDARPSALLKMDSTVAQMLKGKVSVQELTTKLQERSLSSCQAISFFNTKWSPLPRDSTVLPKFKTK